MVNFIRRAACFAAFGLFFPQQNGLWARWASRPSDLNTKPREVPNVMSDLLLVRIVHTDRAP